MKRKSLVLAGLGVAAIGFITGAVVSTSLAGDHDMSEEAMMQKWMEYASPSDAHHKLAKAAGDWNIKSTRWEYPGAEPVHNTMTASLKPILDGRYMVETVKGEFDMGEGHMMPFEGKSISGFDNLTGKYVFCWVDTFMTGIMFGEGTSSDDGKTITYYSKNAPNPITGEYDTTKMVSHDKGNKNVSEFFRKGPDGSWFKEMELVYTRAH